jgi:hypothetical protein
VEVRNWGGQNPSTYKSLHQIAGDCSTLRFQEERAKINNLPCKGSLEGRKLGASRPVNRSRISSDSFNRLSRDSESTAQQEHLWAVGGRSERFPTPALGLVGGSALTVVSLGLLTRIGSTSVQLRREKEGFLAHKRRQMKLRLCPTLGSGKGPRDPARLSTSDIYI